ncbi:MAG: hypothetical protein ACTS6A_02050 [Candidatus Hodgkinia cicadicola]
MPRGSVRLKALKPHLSAKLRTSVVGPSPAGCLFASPSALAIISVRRSTCSPVINGLLKGSVEAWRPKLGGRPFGTFLSTKWTFRVPFPLTCAGALSTFNLLSTSSLLFASLFRPFDEQKLTSETSCAVSLRRRLRPSCKLLAQVEGFGSDFNIPLRAGNNEISSNLVPSEMNSTSFSSFGLRRTTSEGAEVQLSNRRGSEGAISDGNL